MSDPVKPKLSEIQGHVELVQTDGTIRGKAAAAYLLAVVDVPALLAAVDAVLALHRASEGGWCVDCSEERGPEDAPCATRRAIAQHVDLED